MDPPPPWCLSHTRWLKANSHAIFIDKCWKWRGHTEDLSDIKPGMVKWCHPCHRQFVKFLFCKTCPSQLFRAIIVKWKHQKAQPWSVFIKTQTYRTGQSTKRVKMVNCFLNRVSRTSWNGFSWLLTSLSKIYAVPVIGWSGVMPATTGAQEVYFLADGLMAVWWTVWVRQQMSGECYQPKYKVWWRWNNEVFFFKDLV